MHLLVVTHAKSNSKRSKTLAVSGSVISVISCIICRIFCQNSHITGLDHHKYPAGLALQCQHWLPPRLNLFWSLEGIRYHFGQCLKLYSWIPSLFKNNILYRIRAINFSSDIRTHKSFSHLVLELSLARTMFSSMAYNLENKALDSHMDNRPSDSVRGRNKTSVHDSFLMKLITCLTEYSEQDICSIFPLRYSTLNFWAGPPNS